MTKPLVESRPAGILRAASEIVERGYCKGWEAHDAGFQPVPFDSPEAVAWDAVGAIVKASGYSEVDGMHPLGVARFLGEPTFFALAAMWAAITDTPGRIAEGHSGAELIDFIAGWDKRIDVTKADVVAALERAAVIAQERSDERSAAVIDAELRARRDEARRAS